MCLLMNKIANFEQITTEIDTRSIKNYIKQIISHETKLHSKIFLAAILNFGRNDNF